MLLTLAMNAAVPQLAKSTPLTLNVSTEGFEMSGLDDLYNTDWINWGTGDITHASGYARWSVDVVNPAVYSVTLNEQSTNGFCFHVDIIDPATGEAVTNYARYKSGNAKTEAELDCGQINMSQLEAGTYYIMLTDTVGWSAAKVQSVTLTYVNGDRISIPATLQPGDAMLSQHATLDKSGTVDTLTFAPKTAEWYACDEDYTVAGSQYVKWNIKVQGGKYKFTANTYCKQGHNYRIMVLNANETSTIYSKQEIEGDYDFHNQGINWQVTTDVIDLPAGNYVVMMQGRNYGRVMSVEAEYLGGAIVEAPDTLWPVDALRSERAYINEDNEFRFTDDSHAGYVTSQWGKWNLHVEDAGFYSFTLNAKSTNSHKYVLSLLNSDESLIRKDTLNGSSGTELTATTPIQELAKGDYIVKITNYVNNSHGRVVKIIANYKGGKTLNIPPMTSLLPADAILSDSAGVVSGDPDYINFKVRGHDAYNSTEWAKWRINVTEACSYIFTANVTSTDGQRYIISVLSSDESETIGEKEEPSDIGSGDQTQATDPIALPVGRYIVKIVNPYPYSKGCVKSISVAQATPVTLSEEDTNLEGLTADATVDIQLTRSLVAGMYNTICLPFAVSAAEMSRVFPGAVVKELTSSSIEEGEFVLNLNFSAVSEMEAGVPYIIKPAANIANPKFIGVTIDKTLNPVNTARANFVGNFAKGTIPAGENNLFMGANNTLYFPTVETEILGMRGYFVIHDAPAGVIQRAQIVEADAPAVTTDINRVEVNASVKTIENGQLVIIRDGKKYNVMGVRMK